MKFRLVRLNPLVLTPGEFVLLAARQLDGLRMNTFPARLEVLEDEQRVRDRSPEHPYGVPDWQPVEFVNEFLTDEDNDAREVRPEVQVPVYDEPAKRKKSVGPEGD